MKNNKKLNVVFFGTPSFVLPVLKTIQDHFNLVGVVTAPDAILGRKKLLTPSPVKQYVLDHSMSVPVLTPEQFDTDVIGEIRSLQPDLFVVAAYGKIISQDVLDIPADGALNIHPSLLPIFRGASPLQSAILSGNQETGVTIIKMDAEMDHGPIVAQWNVAIDRDETFLTLAEKTFSQAADKLPTIVERYVSDTIILREQEHEKATYCERVTKENGYFSLDNPPTPQELDRMIRAYYPWPGAWSKIKDQRSNFKIIKFLPEGRVQVEGGKTMKVKDFLNGYPELKPLLERILPE